MPAAPLHPSFEAVISSTRNPVYAKQKLSLSRSRGWLFVRLLLAVFVFSSPCLPRADSLEDAGRVLARKVAAVPQRERHLFLSWQNHSSLAEENSEALKQSFAAELGGEILVEKQEPGAPQLQISVEESPAFYILIASVPAANGEAIRMARIARAALASSGSSGARFRLSKELIWQQQEPILDAVEMSEDSGKPGPLLILNRDSLSLYRSENDRWELQDSKRVPTIEKTVRAPRGEIRLSVGSEKQDSLVLSEQTCDITIAEKIELNCRAASHSWRDGILLASPCDRGVWWLKAESGDWSVPDRLSLRNSSVPKSASSVVELDLPGPALSIASGRRARSDTAVVFNLSTGNYEVYRITLACGN
jgi:hypothetical protein